MSREGLEILCVETEQVFDSLKDAAKVYGVTPAAIRQAIVNKGKCKGHHFLYNNTTEVNARNIKLIERLSVEELEVTKIFRECLRESEKLKEQGFFELFRVWYNQEVTIDECAEISGYSKQYLYQKFRAMKLERGLY